MKKRHAHSLELEKTMIVVGKLYGSRGPPLAGNQPTLGEAILFFKSTWLMQW